MRVLLLSMPDSSEHMPSLAIRMPNGALASLAGNLDPHHHVAIADLILVEHAVRATVERLVREQQPDVVGLSVMTFQRRTALRIIRLIRALRPHVRIVVGGYDPSLAPDAYSHCDSGVDFIVHGEGELTFRELVQAFERDSTCAGIKGLSWRDGTAWRANPPRPVSSLDGGAIRPPRRSARVLGGYTMLGRQIDVVETSRGCTFDCSFCSIIEMRGRNFHRFTFDRVLADIADARAHGARSLFLVDDNITLDVARFAALCEAIVAAGLNHLDYSVQAMTAPLAQHGRTLVPLMRRAGFRYVFLGIENILVDDLMFLRARAKNALRERGRTIGNAATAAIEQLHAHGLLVVGGLIVGNPDDTPEAIDANLQFAARYVDWPYIQHPTPYPRTPMTVDFRRDGLIVNERLEQYDGTTAVVRSRHMSAEDVEFRRWRAERWMKVRHMPAVLRHDPVFVVRNGVRMLRHTFRGTRLRTWLGLEDERHAFARYRAIRERERDYVPGETAPLEVST
jgi:anaerobic magnesium-protoporphyrin IX monomethyl ester cyclase